jgi:hypothetical protein
VIIDIRKRYQIDIQKQLIEKKEGITEHIVNTQMLKQKIKDRENNNNNHNEVEPRQVLYPSLRNHHQ